MSLSKIRDGNEGRCRECGGWWCPKGSCENGRRGVYRNALSGEEVEAYNEGYDGLWIIDPS